MRSTLIIDGGAGRQISAIPALENYVTQHPETTIITYFWTSLFWGNKLLANKIFDNNTKGVFEKIKDTKIIRPEPYYNTNYINNRISMAQAFQEEINYSTEPVHKPVLYLTQQEKNAFYDIVCSDGRKTVLFQPFGSTATFSNNTVTDKSIRSFSKELTLHAIETLLKAGYQVALFDDREIPFIDRTNILNLRNMGIRDWASIAYHCDYYFGCDSAGQHLAYAFNKPGMVIFGGTTQINCGYPEWFINVEKSKEKTYIPYRLAEFDAFIGETNNHDLMNFTQEEINTICEKLIQDIRLKT